MSAVLSTDVLAVLFVDDYVLVGIGYKLLVYRKSTNELVATVDAFYPDRIHGIVEGPERRIVTFGGRSICVFDLNFINGSIEVKPLTVRQKFKDWIIAIGWLVKEEGVQLSILFAHNNLYLYDWLKDQAREFQCEEKCILYGGSVYGERAEDVVVFGGTVFQEIVIWAVKDGANPNEDMLVLHRLKGHKGVIFSVTFDPLTHLICSTSDDRTIRLWTVEDESSESGIVKWNNAEISLMTTMFGHTARVWRAMIRDQFVISIGEDSLVCVWTIEGELINKIEAHHGAAIWSVDVSKECNFIVTGGGDGAVNLWPFENTAKPKIYHLPKHDTYKVPKHVGYLRSGGLVVITEGGKMLCYGKGNDSERELIDIERYSSYCVMQISPCRTYVGLVSIDGYITLYRDNDDIGRLEKVLEEKLMESKIFSMQWLSNDKLLVCGAAGCLKKVSIISNGTVLINSEHILPPGRERWVTAAINHKNILICGDRAGSIHVFKTNQNENDVINCKPENLHLKYPVQTLPKIHGRLGVHSCAIIGRKLLTTGRDGTLRFYELTESKFEEPLRALYLERMPMDWVSSTLKTDTDLYVVGFKEIEFVVYSTVYQRLLIRIPCGGGHRSWDSILRNGTLNFAFIRDKQVNLVSYPLNSLAVPAILNGFHAKEVYCVQQLPSSTGRNILISSGEDRVIRLSCIGDSRFHDDMKQFKTLGVFDGHISNVKSVAIINLEDTETHSKNLIFSGGGRAQLKVWEISVSFDQDVLNSENLNCVTLVSHMLRGTDQQRRRPWRQPEQQPHYIDPETRYMDINAHRLQENPNLVLLFIACSDGFLRILVYNIVNQSIRLGTSIPYNNRCILKTHSFVHNNRLVALTMATDGIVNFWDLDETIEKILQSSDTEDEKATNKDVLPFAKLCLHQCGINSFDLKAIGESEFILATGGDDNLISLVVFNIDRCNNGLLSVHTITKWNCSSSHSTQITGLKLEGRDRLVSVGIDQQLMMFSYSYTDENLSVSLINESMTSVPDVQGMILCYTNKCDKILACVYGKGFELIYKCRETKSL